MAYNLLDPVKVRLYHRPTAADVENGVVDGPWHYSLHSVHSFSSYERAINTVRASLPGMDTDLRVCIDEQPTGEVLQIWHDGHKWVDKGLYA